MVGFGRKGRTFGETVQTITKVGRVLDLFELGRVREQGYAYDFEEAETELCCVAAPIRDHSGEVAASLSLAVPAYRFENCKEKYRTLTVSSTKEVSRNLGYTKVKRPSHTVLEEV